MFFRKYFDLLPLNLVYIVLENSNYVLENNISLAVGTMLCMMFQLYCYRCLAATCGATAPHGVQMVKRRS